MPVGINDTESATEAIESLKCLDDPEALQQSFCDSKWLEDFSKQGPGGGGGGPPGPGSEAIRPSICDQLPNGPPADGSDPGSEPPGQEQIKTEFEKEAEFLQSYMKIGGPVRPHIGHKFSTSYSSLFQENITGFITSCTYKGKPCNDPDYWYGFGMPQFGSCFTFNSAYNFENDPQPDRDATLTGSLYGLSVQVFLDQGNYMLKKLSQKAGARLVIHDPRIAPIPDENGMDLSPNTATSMAVQVNVISRLPHPYDSNCTESWNETKYDIDDTENIYTLAVTLFFEN